MEVFTSGELEAVNGTDAKLKCTFDSTNKVSLATTSVSWNFKPVGRGAEESVFYYQEEPYPPTNGRFKGRAVWAGNIERYDASIILRDVQFSDNGTYTCQVKNPPDVHGTAGEVRLRVVLTGQCPPRLGPHWYTKHRLVTSAPLTRTAQTSQLGHTGTVVISAGLGVPHIFQLSFKSVVPDPGLQAAVPCISLFLFPIELLIGPFN
ncbi:MPZL2 protein, partial [Amia calva]|nr:MPZL2 protein [Amia calva]